MRKKWLRIVAAFGLMLAGGASLLGSSTAVYADENTPSTWIQLSPAAATVTMMGGDRLEGKHERCPAGSESEEGGCRVAVKNIGKENFSYKIYTSPYVVSGSDYQLNFSEDAATSYTQIARWITFLDDDGSYKKEITKNIAPGETQEINYRITVPDDVPGGAQYAVIWAEVTSAESGASVQTAPRTGTVVSGRSIGDTVQSAEISDYQFQRFSIGGSLTAHAMIKNTGNTDFDAYYTYTAKTLFGKEVHDPIKDTIATYPDTEYPVDVKWEDGLPFFGLLRVQFSVTAADQVIDETHLVLIMPVFVIILLILLLTVIIIWIIIINRKRKERKARTLV